MSPSQNLCGGGRAEKFSIRCRKARVNRVCGIKQTVVAEQHAQRQVLANEIRQVAMHLMRINFIDQVRQQHHERSFLAVRVEVHERFVVARFDKTRKAIEAGMEQAVHLGHAAARRHVGVNLVGEANQPHGIALAKCDEAEHEDRVQRMIQQAEP